MSRDNFIFPWQPGKSARAQSLGRVPPERLCEGKSYFFIGVGGEPSSDRGRDLPGVSTAGLRLGLWWPASRPSALRTAHSEISETDQGQVVKMQACGHGQITARN